MDMNYCFYMAEADGVLPTRRGKINAAINDIKAYPYSPIEFDVFESILNKHGLSYDKLSWKEVQYINDMIE